MSVGKKQHFPKETTSTYGKNSQSVAGSSIINLLLYFIRIGISFLTVILASRWLGAEKYGEFNLLLSYTFCLSYFLSLGFDHGLPFFISKANIGGHSNSLSLFFRIIKIIVIFDTIFLLCAGGVIFYLFKDSKQYLLLSMFILTFQNFIFVIGNVCAVYLRGHKIFTPWILKEQIITPVMHLVFLVVFVKFLDMGVLGQSIAYFFASVFAALAIFFFLWPFVKKQLKEKKERFRVGTKKLIGFSLPLGLMSGLEPAMLMASIILAGNLMGPSESAYITVCNRLAVFVHFLFIALQPIFTPYIADHLRAGEKGEVKALYQSINFWSAKWSLLMLFGITVNSGFLLGLFEMDFPVVEKTLYFILPGFFLNSALGSSRQSLIMGGDSKTCALSYILAISANIALSLLFYELYGLYALGIALSLSFLILNAMVSFRFYAVYGIPPFDKKHFILLTLALAILSILGYLIKISYERDWEILVAGSLVLSVGFVLGFWKERHLFIGRFLNNLQMKRIKTP